MRPSLLLAGAFLAASAAAAPHGTSHSPRTVSRRAHVAQQQRAARQQPRPAVLKPRTVLVGGCVLLPDGRPAAGARVFVSWLRKPNTCELMYKTLTPDRDGRFRQPVTSAASYVEVAALVPDQA